MGRHVRCARAREKNSAHHWLATYRIDDTAIGAVGLIRRPGCAGEVRRSSDKLFGDGCVKIATSGARRPIIDDFDERALAIGCSIGRRVARRLAFKKHPCILLDEGPIHMFLSNRRKNFRVTWARHLVEGAR